MQCACVILSSVACLTLQHFNTLSYKWCGPGSSVGVVTAYGQGSPGIECRWGARFSAPVQTDPEAHTASCTMGTGSLPGVKCVPGLDADRLPPSSAEVKNRVELYLYSP